MDWASVASELPEARAAASEAIELLRRELDQRPPDLLIVFASHHHAGGYEVLAGMLGQAFPSSAIVRQRSK